MGWLCDCTFRGSKSDVKEQLRYKILNGWSDFNIIIEKERFTNDALFCLIKMYCKHTGILKNTFVDVQMYNLSDGLCVKSISERAGPTVLANKSFVEYLNIHHPVTEEYALNWRERCLEGAVKSKVLKTNGAVIKTHYEIFYNFGM